MGQRQEKVSVGFLSLWKTLHSICSSLLLDISLAVRLLQWQSAVLTQSDCEHWGRLNSSTKRQTVREKNGHRTNEMNWKRDRMCHYTWREVRNEEKRVWVKEDIFWFFHCKRKVNRTLYLVAYTISSYIWCICNTCLFKTCLKIIWIFYYDSFQIVEQCGVGLLITGRFWVQT